MSLKALIAKQQAAKQGGITGGANAQAPDQGNGGGDVGTQRAAVSGDSAGPKSALKLGGGLKVGQSKPAQAAASKAAPAKAESPVEDGAMLSLADLGDSEDMGDTDAPSDTRSYAFSDEIPCTAPTRDLPEDLTAQQLAFVQSLDSAYEILHDPDLFGNFVRTIMAELQENPDHIRFVADEDVHTLIRGLRESMGLARIKKAEGQRKSRGTGATKKVSAPAMLTTADEMFNADDW